MNREYFNQLLERCRQTPIWDELNERGYHFGLHSLSADQVAFIAIADHVETWTTELERIMEALLGGRDEDYSPQNKWPPAAWIAYHSGRLCSIDLQMNGMLACITGSERDSIPGFNRFSRLYDEARHREHQLRIELGLEAK